MYYEKINNKVRINFDFYYFFFNIQMFGNYTYDMGDIEEMDDENTYNYLLIVSTKNCKYSDKLFDIINDKNMDKTLKNKMEIYDIIKLYQKREPYPYYIDYVPALILCDSVTNDVQDILYGSKVFEVIKSYIKKGSYSEEVELSNKINYCASTKGFTNKKWMSSNPEDKDDPSIFQERFDTVNTPKNIETALNDYSKEYDQMNNELGGVYNIKQQSEKKAENDGGGGFYGREKKDKKKKKGVKAYNT